MKKSYKNLAAALIACSLFSCVGNVKPKEETMLVDNLANPAFDIRSFFSGNIEGFGIVHDKNGKLIATEKMNITAKWRDKKGIIEKSYYGDSSKENSTWLVESRDDASFSVIGHGFSGNFDGKQVGNAAKIKYRLKSKNKEGIETQNEVIESFYMVDENSVISVVENFSGIDLISKETLSLKKILNNSTNPSTSSHTAISKAKE